MPDPISEVPETNPTPEPATEPERTVPLSALQEARAAKQALAAELADLKAAQEAAAQKRAEEQGEFQALYEKVTPELESLRAEVDGFRTRETARIERVTTANVERLEALPDTLKALAPEGLDPDTLAGWLNRAEKQATTESKRPAGTQTHGGTKSSGIPAELRARVEAEAAKNGKTVEDWWKIRSRVAYQD